jgi:hypothetical protein
MSRTFTTVLSALLVLCIPTAVGAQIQSAGSGSWTVGATWVGGVPPTAINDVVIKAGHAISVGDTNAVCRSVSFGDSSAHIKMNSNSMLTVYGNFTLFSQTHNVFSNVFSVGWSATNAYIKFAGDAVQTLSGWSTTGGSTSFRDVIIDKTGGKVTTGGNNMRLCIQNSLNIVNGLLELAADDDIEGRFASSGNYVTGGLLPNMTIRQGGEFYLVGTGVHHIRAGTGVAIGTVTVYGKATFQNASTNRIILNGINVEDGGKVITTTGMGTGLFTCGPLVIKSGGEVENYTTSDIYPAGSSLTINAGGVFDTKASTTIFPVALTNNGTVRYSREALTLDQTVVDMNYYRLEISFDPDNYKNWALGASRAIADSLKVNYDGNLVLTAASPLTLTLGNMLHLSSGTIDNSDPDVSFVLSNGLLIKRVTGTITAAPVFAGMVDLIYASTSTNVTTGPEMPAGTGVLRDLTLTGDQGMTLGAHVTVNGVCSLPGSDITTGSYVLTLGPAASLVESAGKTVIGTARATRTASQSVNQTFGGLGLEVNAGGGAPGVTTVTRVTGTALDINGTAGIQRYFDVSPANNAGLGATVVLHYDESELNGIDESLLAAYSRIGGVWSRLTATLDPTNNAVTITGVDEFGTLTLGHEGVVATLLQAFACAPTPAGIEVSWTLSEAARTDAFRVSRSEGADGAFQPIAVEIVETGALSYRFADAGCEAGVSYCYRVDLTGERGAMTLFLTPAAAMPAPKLQLSQNYPNPFKPTTVIGYSLPAKAHVVLDIYDLGGRRVARLVDGEQSAGSHTRGWSGTNDAGTQAAGGVYFSRLSVGKETITRRRVLLK